jgi:glycerophosphoryl diester phosphodiesterase
VSERRAGRAKRVAAAAICVAAAAGCDAVRPTSDRGVASPAETLTVRAAPNVFDGASAQAPAPVALRASGSTRPTVTWSSGDRRIALVNREGLVVGRAPGTSVVMASLDGRASFTTVQVVPPSDGAIRLIAHRGFMRRFPENTLVAVRGAFDEGADAVEEDVRQSADRVPGEMHDETVDRTTNGTGAVRGLSTAELGTLDACARAAGDPPPCAVPLMSDVLREARGRGGVLLHLYGRYTNDDLERMLAAVRAAGMDRETIFISFDFGVLRALRQLDQVASLGYLTERPPAPIVVDALGRMAPIVELQSAAADPARTREYLSAASRRRQDAAVWVAWNQDQARQAVALGFRTIIADVPIDRTRLLP